MSGEGILANAPAIGPNDHDGPDGQDPGVNDARAIIWAFIAFEVVSLRPLTTGAQLADTAMTLARLGCDQVDCIGIALSLEEQFSIEVPDDIITRDRTIDQVADAVLPLTAKEN